MKRLDLTGHTYYRLTVNSVAEIRHKKTFWSCTCECGNKSIVCTEHLRSGHTKSCGCFRRDHQGTTKHGFARTGKKTTEYKRWEGMVKRCHGSVLNYNYKFYGGRGIKVCPEWRHSFATFFADMGECPPGHELDRINPDGDYSKENCRWVSVQENKRNMRNNRKITINGVTKIVAEWCEEFNISPSIVYQRLFRKWPEERLFTPKNNRRLR